MAIKEQNLIRQRHGVEGILELAVATHFSHILTRRGYSFFFFVWIPSFKTGTFEAPRVHLSHFRRILLFFNTLFEISVVSLGAVPGLQ